MCQTQQQIKLYLRYNINISQRAYFSDTGATSVNDINSKKGHVDLLGGAAPDAQAIARFSRPYFKRSPIQQGFGSEKC